MEEGVGEKRQPRPANWHERSVPVLLEDRDQSRLYLLLVDAVLAVRAPPTVIA
jgi:hypothetical protein